jgi:DNA polymerase III sliding clamp (beta) subunit (PCNA family)
MIEMNAASLRFLLKSVLPAMSTDTTREALTQVEFRGEEGWIVAIATDGHRLHRAKVRWAQITDGTIAPIGRFVVRGEHLTALAKALPPTPKRGNPPPVTLAPSGATWAGTSLAFRASDSPFPEADRVIPASREGDAAVKFAANPEYLTDACEAARLLGRNVGVKIESGESPLDPICLRATGYVGAESAEFLAVVMPMRA